MPHVDTENLRISFVESGSKHGRPVLLRHGWPDDASTWEMVGLKTPSESQYEAYCAIPSWDRPSVFQNPDALRTANGAILAMDAIALMDALGVDTFSVVGHDWGSNIAEGLAVGWPQRVERMALISSLPRMGGLKTPSFRQAQRYLYH